jgi:hypothetical protein
VTPEEVRTAALARLSAHADPRGREALERGQLSLVPTPESWTSEQGDVAGVRVGVGLDPAGLASILGAHGAKDELVVALASAIASFAGHALTALVFHHAERATATTPYRGALEPWEAARSVEQFLHATGEPNAAEWARGARFTLRGGDLVVVPTPPREHAQAVERAARALFAGVEERALRIVAK